MHPCGLFNRLKHELNGVVLSYEFYGCVKKAIIIVGGVLLNVIDGMYEDDRVLLSRWWTLRLMGAIV